MNNQIAEFMGSIELSGPLLCIVPKDAAIQWKAFETDEELNDYWGLCSAFELTEFDKTEKLTQLSKDFYQYVTLEGNFAYIYQTYTKQVDLFQTSEGIVLTNTGFQPEEHENICVQLEETLLLIRSQSQKIYCFDPVLDGFMLSRDKTGFTISAKHSFIGNDTFAFNLPNSILEFAVVQVSNSTQSAAGLLLHF